MNKRILLLLCAGSIQFSSLAETTTDQLPWKDVAEALMGKLDAISDMWATDIKEVSGMSSEANSLLAEFDNASTAEASAIKSVMCQYNLNEDIIKYLTASLQSAEATLNSLKNELAHYITTKEGLEAQIEDLQKQIDEISAAIQELVGNDEELAHQFMDKLHQMEARFYDMQNARANLNSAILNLQERIKSFALKAKNDLDELRLTIRKNYSDVCGDTKPAR